LQWRLRLIPANGRAIFYAWRGPHTTALLSVFDRLSEVSQSLPAVGYSTT
jgi:hypothetical protein